MGLKTSLRASKIVSGSSYLRFKLYRVRQASLPSQFTARPACLFGGDSSNGLLNNTLHSDLNLSNSESLSSHHKNAENDVEYIQYSRIGLPLYLTQIVKIDISTENVEFWVLSLVKHQVLTTFLCSIDLSTHSCN